MARSSRPTAPTVVARRDRSRSAEASRSSVAPYLVIVRAPDGRTRTEQFQDPLTYRMRLATLQSSDTVSLDELVGLLDN